MPRARRVVCRLVLAAAMLLAAASPARAAWPEASEGVFDGYWAASGTVHVVEFGENNPVAAGRLTGTVTIQTSQGYVPSFETDCVAFAESRTGGMGRCVWTSTSGDQVFVEMASSGGGGFGRSRGTFVGGTGRFESLSGSFDFEWTWNLRGGSDATLDVNSVRMTGRYRIGSR